MVRLTLSWRGVTHEISIDEDNPTLGTLGAAVERELGASLGTQKLLVTGRKGHVAPAQHPEQRASEAGLVSGSRALLLASRAEEVEAVRAAKDLPLLRGFDEELKRAARRRRTAASTAAGNPQPPRGEWTFHGYQAWERPGLQPPPAQALKLLYRLASDPGIVGVMAAHRYRVGLLSEMPPEGKVGVSPVCVLGVNINAGQEISLRLRTDDLKGFRKYERIRETLVHELAHMEHSEHGLEFKQLNSALGREAAAINARYTGGHALAALDGGDDEPRTSELDAVPLYDEDDVMAVTAQSSGRTLRQLAAADAKAAAASRPGRAAPVPAAGARAAAAAAALQRAQAPVAGPGVAGPVEPTPNVEAAAAALTETAAAADASAGSAEEASGSGSEGDEGVGRGFEHYDERTEAAEAAARRLESLDEPLEGPAAAQTQPAQLPKELGAEAGAAAMEVDVGPAGLVAGQVVNSPGQDPATGAPSHPTPPVQPMDVDTDRPVPAPAASGTQEPASSAAAIGASTHASVAPSPPAAAAAPTPVPAPPAPPVRLVLSVPDLSPDGPGAGAEAEDVATQKARQAWRAVQTIVSSSSSSSSSTPSAAAVAPAVVVTALDTLETLLGNAAHFPADPKYRRVKLSNAAFQRRVGRLPGALEVLRVAGFAEEQEGGGAGSGAGGGVQGHRVGGAAAAGVGERVMRLRRDDPGLLWLVASVVRDARAQVAEQLGGATGGAV
ncbi:hypothetical protein HYH03_000225 [Edaphochlamys debaryana]|uniref:WLM domain-containing protein n=1 Tax=Edaphochlamys debaryana TaxID=47281 RepID=A0A835YNJ0_9CHLO|nr:hypothetical protein HYH03_000225 [Edaphochlamys debaryana]|eukprot:KAG2501725.1 hypothetical protein HYH03_000225 [Edaphochlamys debaryana]